MHGASSSRYRTIAPQCRPHPSVRPSGSVSNTTSAGRGITASTDCTRSVRGSVVRIRAGTPFFWSVLARFAENTLTPFTVHVVAARMTRYGASGDDGRNVRSPFDTQREMLGQ